MIKLVQKIKRFLQGNSIRIPKHRKGVKWSLAAIYNKPLTRLLIFALVLIILFSVSATAISSCGNGDELPKPSPSSTPTTPSSLSTANQATPTSHIISDVPVVSQSELSAGCEIYACSMIMKYMNFDFDVLDFAENYLITKPITYDEQGNRYGPDMYSAYAGDVYTGYGIYAPAMAECMNRYLNETGTGYKAYPLSGVSLESLCKEYIDNDIPVMVWVTTYMNESTEEKEWIVDYVDENAVHKPGDTETWTTLEHCVVLSGYDADKFYFNDSMANAVMSYDKALSQKRYSQLGAMAIVVKK